MKRAAAPPLVVFVCEHGSAKSLVAALFLERMAKELGMAVGAVSRGTSPDASVPAPVVTALREDGFDVASFRPRAVSGTDVSTAARVVAMGVGSGELKGRAAIVERWDDVPPISVSYDKAREVILSRIRALLRDLGP